MLHTIFGVLLLIGSAVLLLKYRPREREARMTWCVCVGLALLSLIMQDGAWYLQLIEHTAQVVAFFSCLCALHQEKVLRQRRAARAHRNVTPLPVQKKERQSFCA